MIAHKLTTGLQYTQGLRGKGMANASSGLTCAKMSCKCLSYAITTMLQVVEKFTKEELARQSKVDTKKSTIVFSRKNV